MDFRVTQVSKGDGCAGLKKWARAHVRLTVSAVGTKRFSNINWILYIIVLHTTGHLRRYHTSSRRLLGREGVVGSCDLLLPAHSGLAVDFRLRMKSACFSSLYCAYLLETYRRLEARALVEQSGTDNNGVRAHGFLVVVWVRRAVGAVVL